MNFAPAIKRYMKKALMIILSACMATAAVAQDTDNDSTSVSKEKELGEVVVTGQYKPQSVKNSVYQVRVITKERIQKQAAVKLQDVLNNELNIRFSQDAATGGSDITMLGLSGKNVKILVDGMPMIGRQGTSNEININQIDVNSIERIEIVEGPMSVVYGADALAGVINIITKKASPNKLSVTARLQEETVGKEYGVKGGIHNQYAGLTWRHNRWEIGGGFGYNYFGGWQGDSTNRELAWHWKDQITGNGVIGYHTSKFSIRYRFDGLDEVITNPGNFTRYQGDADDWFAPDQEYLTRRAMHQLQSSYFVNSDLSFQAQAAYTDYSRQVFSTLVSQKTGVVTMDPAPGVQSLVEFNGFTFRTTAQYRLSSVVSFQPGVDINLERGKGERLNEGTNAVDDYAFFITSEISPTSKINIRPGFRFIKNSVYDAPPVIPSVNVKMVLTRDLDIRLAYARGFRSPTLRELYFNFIDANHQIFGNPDLKAETSNSFTGSVTWKAPKTGKFVFTSAVSGFYNDVNNLIDYAFNPNTNEAILTNISDSKTAGASINNTLNFRNLSISLGGSYTGFYNDYSEADKKLPTLQWSPEINSGIGYTFPKIGLDANLFYKFTGKRPLYTTSGQDVVLAKQEGYHNADVTVNKKLLKLFTITAGVRNLFDVINLSSTVNTGGSHTSGASRVIGYGRSYFAGLSFNWDKK
jgi:outer membrane receptor for ferrienterochelin and colicins